MDREHPTGFDVHNSGKQNSDGHGGLGPGRIDHELLFLVAKAPVSWHFLIFISY